MLRVCRADSRTEMAHLWYALVGKLGEQPILGVQPRHGERDGAENRDQDDGKCQPQSRADLQVSKKHRFAPCMASRADTGPPPLPRKAPAIPSRALLTCAQCLN